MHSIMKVLLCLSYCVASVLTSPSILTGIGLDTSSTYPEHPPELAIDGDESTNFMSDPTKSGDAYWQIDLGGRYDVHEIVIHFPNMDRSRPENRTISLSTNSTFEPADTFLCGQNLPKLTSVLQCDGLFAVQYIRVTTDQPPLVLNEIVIYGLEAEQSVSEDSTSSEAATTTTTETTTITAVPTLQYKEFSNFLFKNNAPVETSPSTVTTTTAEQTSVILTGKGLKTSSTLGGYPPERAIDGDVETYFLSNPSEPGDAYWQIDLEAYYDVQEIVVHFSDSMSVRSQNRTIALSMNSTFEPAHTFLCGQNLPKRTSTLICQKLFAVRYIRVAIDFPPLDLNEIEIYGDEAVQSVTEDSTSVTSSSDGTSLETATTTATIRSTVSSDTTPIGTSPAIVTTTTLEPTSAGSSPASGTITTQGTTSGSSYRVIPDYTVETPTATLTTPTSTMCSMWCQQSPGCTAFSFNKALPVNNCKTSASEQVTPSSGWTAHIRSSTMKFRREGFSCSFDGI